MGKRTVEFVLGLIGGIFGFFGALIALMFGGIGYALGGKGASTVIGLGWLAILFSIIGIVGAALVKSKTKLGGWMMIISAIGGVISVSFAYALSFILLIIAGLMAVIRKGDKK
ncbi:DUF4064 domain-containing protein [Candidatus Woesearchaeota archaeon]|nr:DUF4064 domain-containing protein [Candidatus Woesearchaeota archaeon]